jgi:hypothetical protein
VLSSWPGIKVGVSIAVCLGGLRSRVHQQARGIKNVIVRPMRFQEMVQPEPRRNPSRSTRSS